MAVSILGAAAYLLPQMADMSIFTVLGITMHCMCSSARSAQGGTLGGGRHGAGAV